MDLKDIDFEKLGIDLRNVIRAVAAELVEDKTEENEECVSELKTAPDSFTDFLLEKQADLIEGLTDLKDYYEEGVESMPEVEHCLQQMHDTTVKINFLDELIEAWSDEFGDEEDEDDDTDEGDDEEPDEEDSDDESVKTYVFKITL